MKTITQKEYWQALGLYLAAKEKQKEVNALEEQMNCIFGRDNGDSHSSDFIYDHNVCNNKESFDKSLKLSDVEVESGNE